MRRDQRETPQLRYLIDSPPEAGSVTRVDEGVYWLRMPMPIPGLDHINLYLIEDVDQWVIVDTGLGMKVAQEIWDKVLTQDMDGRPVSRVIATHLHPDHVGNAGWLSRRFDAPLSMSREEYFLCRLMAADTGQPAPQEGIDFYTKCGLTDEQIDLYKSKFGGFGKAITTMPHSYERLKQGDVIKIGRHEWQVEIGSGHSPEHVCLWCKELNLFLSGDQILPRISSNVSVWPTEPDGNPLHDWLQSCLRLSKTIGDEDLVCPAHGIPFYGGPARLLDLVQKHENALARLLEYCETPRLATEVYSVLFRAKITDANRALAVGESVAHLNLLLSRGEISRTLNDKGQYVYEKIS